MPSLPLDNTHDLTTSCLTCNHRFGTAHTVGLCQAWNDITALVQHTRSNVVWRCTTSPPLDNTHSRQHRAWHDITALGQHTRSDDVGRGMTSPRLGSIHDQTTSGVALHHRPWAAHTVDLRRAWHDITSFRQHTRSNDVVRGMPSSPLGSTHGRMTSGVTFHHRLWEAQKVKRRRAWHAIIAFGKHKLSNDIGRCMPSSPLGSTNFQTTSDVACHHSLWAAHTVERRRAWHAIIALRQNKWSNDVRHGRTSPPLDSTHGLTTSGVA